MEHIGIPENEYVAFIQEKGIGNKAKLVAIDGFYAWEITRDDGTKYIADVIEGPKPWYYKFQKMYWKTYGYFWTKYNAYKYSN